MKKPEKIIFSVQMPAKTVKDLERICNKYGVSRGGLIRYVVNNYLRSMKENNNIDEDLIRLIEISPDL